MGSVIEFIPLIAPLLAGFAWLIRLEAAIKANKQESVSLVSNLKESKVDPLEREVKRLESDHIELSRSFFSETKEIRQELGRHLGLLNDIRVLLAEMKGKMDDGPTNLNSKSRDRENKSF